MLLQIRSGQSWDFYEVVMVRVWRPEDRDSPIGYPATFNRGTRIGMPNEVLCERPTMLLEIVGGFQDAGADAVGFVATDWAAVVLPTGLLVDLVPTDKELLKDDF